MNDSAQQYTVARVKGTRDDLQAVYMQTLQSVIRSHLQTWGFNEIETPIMEPLSLFIRALGDQTDVVSKEMYQVVPVAQKGENTVEDAIALRPELTASILRAVVQGQVAKLPFKTYAIGPCFRHERPQKGRFRQFTQASIELIGSSQIMHDALVLQMLDQLFRKLLHNHYELHINFLGNKQDRVRHQEALVTFLQAYQKSVCQTCVIRMQRNPLRVFDCKNSDCQKIYESAPALNAYLGEVSQHRWNELRRYLDSLQVVYTINHRLVRGLDYYVDTVFEFVATDGLGSQNTFCGGGRYDTLALLVGAKNDLPSFGAGIGIERLLLLLKDRSYEGLCLPKIGSNIVIIPFDTSLYSLAISIFILLQQQGIVSDIIAESGSVKNLMRRAHDSGAQFALLIGSQEAEAGTVIVKNMQTGMQETVMQEHISQYCKQRL